MRSRKLHLGVLYLLAAVVVSTALPGCEADAVSPVDRPRVHGIVEWTDHPFGGESAETAPAGGPHGATVSSQETPGVLDTSQASLRGQLLVPDNVQAGQPVSVTVTTIGPSMCWNPAAIELESDGNRIELTAFDRGPGIGEMCAMQLKPITRTVEVTFPTAGEGTLVLIGRRVEGSDEAIAQNAELGEVHQIEVTVTVQ